MVKILKIAMLVCLVSLAVAGRNPLLALEAPGFKAEWWSRGTVDLRHERPYEDQTSDHETFLLETEGEASSLISFKAGVRLDRLAFHHHKSSQEDTRLELWETYLRYQGESLELTLGNQIIRWGKTDEMTVLDNLNPQDLRELLTLRLEERKRPWPWLRAQYFASGYTLEGVFTLWPVWHIKDDLGTDWAVFDHLKEQLEAVPSFSTLARSLRLAKERPGPSLRDAEWGFRITGTVAEIDWEISFLHAHNRSFYYYVKSFPIQGFRLENPSNPVQDLLNQQSNLRVTGTEIKIGRPQDNIFGLAFETTWGDAGLRGEFAYHTDRVFLKRDLLGVRKGYWRYVIGLDYQFPSGLYVNLQFLQQRVLGWNEDILFDPKLDSGLFLRLSKSFWQDFLEARLDGYYDLTTRMYYLNPEIRYKIRDNLTLFGGLHLLDGPKGTFLDVYDDNDQVYAGLKATF